MCYGIDWRLGFVVYVEKVCTSCTARATTSKYFLNADANVKKMLTAWQHFYLVHSFHFFFSHNNLSVGFALFMKFYYSAITLQLL